MIAIVLKMSLFKINNKDPPPPPHTKKRKVSFSADVLKMITFDGSFE